MLYYKGAGVPKDLEQAAYWRVLSANRGNADAKKLLDEILSISEPEPEDIDPYNEATGTFDDAEETSSGWGWGTMIAALLVMMVVIGGAGAGCYYFFMRPSAPARNPRNPEHVQQSTPSRSKSGTENTSSRTAGA